MNVPKSGSVTAVTLKGKAVIRLLSFSIPRDQASGFENVHLRVTWDGSSEPSVDAPMALFFGAGTLFNRDKGEYLVKAFPVSIRFTHDWIYLSCYFPIPYFKSARIELVGSGQVIDSVEWSIRSLPSNEPANQLAYFDAT